jgi:hypothetical protein
MRTSSNEHKEIRIPGPDHPITISPAEGKVRITVAGRIVAESTRALRLEEKGYPLVYYLPRNDADMSLLARTNHYTYCPYARPHPPEFEEQSSPATTAATKKGGEVREEAVRARREQAPISFVAES